MIKIKELLLKAKLLAYKNDYAVIYFCVGFFIVGPITYTLFTFDPFKIETNKKTDLQRPVYEFVVNDDETVLF